MKRFLRSIKEFIWPKDFLKKMRKGNYYRQGKELGQQTSLRAVKKKKRGKKHG